MIAIKVSKEGKFYLSNNKIRVSIDYDEIEMLNEYYFACIVKELDFSQTYYFINTSTIQTDLTITDCIFSGTSLGNKNIFILNQKRNYHVFESKTLKKIITVSKTKDYHQFAYISDSYYFLDDNLYCGDDVLGKLNEFDNIYIDKHGNCIRNINDFYLYSYEREGLSHQHRYYTIIKDQLPIDINRIEINSLISNSVYIFIKSDNIYHIFYEGFLIHKCNIDEQNTNFTTNFVDEIFIHFYIENNLYFLTNNQKLQGPYVINNFKYNEIHDNIDYKLFYSNKHIIKYDKSTHSIIVEMIDFDFIVPNTNNLLYMDNCVYKALEYQEHYYYYNNKTNDFVKLIDAIEIKPYIYDNKIYYLDNNLVQQSLKPKIDVLDLSISDYIYFKGNLYIILADSTLLDGYKSDNNDYIIFDVTNNTILKTFDNFIKFNSKKQFLLADTYNHTSSSIYTLDEACQKIIKLPFKTKGIFDIENGIRIQNMNTTNVIIPNNESIYIKE